MRMNPPVLPQGFVNAPSRDELITALRLIEHATAPTHDDGAHHEAAHEIASEILGRADAAEQCWKEAACGASPAPTGCASSGTNNERTDK